MARRRTYALDILNLLMNSGQYLDTAQIKSRVGCDRKTVYSCIAQLECAGFGIDVKGGGRGHYAKYKYIGLFGGGADT